MKPRNSQVSAVSFGKWNKSLLEQLYSLQGYSAFLVEMVQPKPARSHFLWASCIEQTDQKKTRSLVHIVWKQFKRVPNQGYVKKAVFSIFEHYPLSDPIYFLDFYNVVGSKKRVAGEEVL